MKGVRVLVTKLVIEDAKVDFCWGISLILTNFPFCDWWFATPFVWYDLNFNVDISNFIVIGVYLMNVIVRLRLCYFFKEKSNLHLSTITKI